MTGATTVRELEGDRLEELVRSFARLRLLVAGDVMLDEYLWGEVDRVSPEAPVPVVHVRRESLALGGAGNVLRNVVAMGAESRFCTIVGEDAAGDRIVDLLKELGVEAAGVVRVEGRPTTRKTRVEARSQQMLRFDRESDGPLPPRVSRGLLAALEAALPLVQGVVLEDYGKGALVPRLVRATLRRCAERGIAVAVDPKELLTPYRGADLVKPNLRELETLTGRRIRSDDDLSRAVTALRRRLGGADVVVTRGAEGMTIFPSGAEPLRVPIAGSEVFDVQGAGDTSIAALALARLAGASLLESAVIANAAAGVVVAKVGTATASPDEICALLPRALIAARGEGS